MAAVLLGIYQILSGRGSCTHHGLWVIWRVYLWVFGHGDAAYAFRPGSWKSQRVHAPMPSSGNGSCLCRAKDFLGRYSLLLITHALSHADAPAFEAAQGHSASRIYSCRPGLL